MTLWEKHGPVLEAAAAAKSARDIVLLRIAHLDAYHEGIASLLVPIVCDETSAFLERCRDYVTGARIGDLAKQLETHNLRQILLLSSKFAALDPVLYEELGAEGIHKQLLRIINFDDTTLSNEDDLDTLRDLQDSACGIMSHKGLHQNAFPFTLQELRQRLPIQMSFGIGGLGESSAESETVLIQEVTLRQTAQEDVGFVLWPSTVVLSHLLASNPNLVENKRILELGAGCGLAGLVAARLIKRRMEDGSACRTMSHVIFSDFNKVVLENLKHNVALNDVEDFCTVVGLDFYDQSGQSNHWIDTIGIIHEPVDVILAADIICQPSDAFQVANTIHDALRPGGTAYMVSAGAAHRFGIDHFVDACQRVKLEVHVDTFDDRSLTGELAQTSGYVPGMQLTIFVIQRQPL